MDEVLILTSSKDTSGMMMVDMNGSAVGPAFKQCLTDQGGLALVGGDSSFAGRGECVDYIVAAQSRKPVVNLYCFGKPQVHMQFHLQEIVSAVAADPSGTFLAAGSRSGRLYVWNISDGILLRTWQAHFRAVTTLSFTSDSTFVVTASEDGMGRLWDVAMVVDAKFRSTAQHTNKSIQPFRSWSSHTLPVRGMALAGFASSIRVLTCSQDRTVAMFDAQSNSRCFRKSLPHSLECLTLNRLEDTVYCGSSSGVIFIVNMSLAALELSAAHAEVSTIGTLKHAPMGLKTEPTQSKSSGTPVPSLEGHKRAVTGLVFSTDGVTLASASEDGSILIWDTLTRQCIRDLSPFKDICITNIALTCRPEVLALGTLKPALLPLAHLKKYTDQIGKDAQLHPGKRFIGSTQSTSYQNGKIDGEFAIFSSTKWGPQTTEGQKSKEAQEKKKRRKGKSGLVFKE
jgi:pre-rRNA-processing protein IPI3